MILKPRCRLVLSGLFFFALVAQIAPAADAVDDLHEKALVWDCHNDLAYRILYEGLDIGERLPAGHVDIPRLEEGGVDVQTVALFVQNFLYPDKCARQAFQLLEATRKAIDEHSDSVELARTGSDVERIVASGKIAMPLSIEGGHAIEDDLGLLRKFHEMGVSAMTLTHNVTHGWADSGADEKKWNGLNELGKDVVREMQYQDLRQHYSAKANEIIRKAKQDDIRRTPKGGLASKLNSHVAWRLIRALQKLDVAYGEGDFDAACAALTELIKIEAAVTK